MYFIYSGDDEINDVTCMAGVNLMVSYVKLFHPSKIKGIALKNFVDILVCFGVVPKANSSMIVLAEGPLFQSVILV